MRNGRARLPPSRKRRRMANSEWRMVNRKTLNSHHNAQPATQFYALRFTHYAQLIFGANAPPTLQRPTHFYASRITLYASNSQPATHFKACPDGFQRPSPIKGDATNLNSQPATQNSQPVSGLTPLLPTYNSQLTTRNPQPSTYALRITLYASNSQLIFGANAPPTSTPNQQPATHNLIFTLYALRITPFSRPSPLVPFRYVCDFRHG